MSQGMKVGLLVWFLGVLFLFWIHPFYVLLFSIAMLGLGVLVYMIENRNE
jgi:hypothetical protein